MASRIKSLSGNLEIDATSGNIKFLSSGTEVGSISSAGLFTSTTIDATKLTGSVPSGSGATESYVDAAIVNALASEMTFKGSYDASANSPDLDTSPVATAIGDMYVVTVAGTFFSTTVEVGDTLISEINSPTVEADWTVVNKNLDAASIKTTYEGNADTNAYNDAAVSKLAAIEASATADQTGAEIKVAYEGNANTNAYNDAAVSKLAAIEASADVTDVTNVTAAGALMDSELAGLAAVKATTGTFLIADQTKLDGIATGSNLATTPSHVGLSSLSSSGNALSGNFTITGTLDVQGGIIEDATTGTTSFDVSTASVFTTTSTSGAFTFSGAPTSGKVGSVTLVSTPSGTPAYTWHASVKWAGATAPTASGSGLTDIFTFFTVDGGTTWHGVISSLNSA